MHFNILQQAYADRCKDQSVDLDWAVVDLLGNTDNYTIAQAFNTFCRSEYLFRRAQDEIEQVGGDLIDLLIERAKKTPEEIAQRRDELNKLFGLPAGM